MKNLAKNLFAGACLTLLLGTAAAQAATYTYTGATGTDDWSSGNNWDSTPLSGIDSVLAFSGTMAAGDTVTVNNDYSGTFQLNELIFSYVGPASGTAPEVTISGGTLEFINNGSSNPILRLGPTGTIRPILTLSNDLVLTDNLTITNQNPGNLSYNATLSGQISGSGALIIGGGLSSGNVDILTISNTANDWSGGLIMSVSSTSGGSRTLRLGASEVISNGVGKGDVELRGSNEGNRTIGIQMMGYNETINGLVGNYGANAQNKDSGQFIENGGASDSTLTLGDNNATASYWGVIRNGTGGGVLNLVKTGSGTQTFTARSTHTGSTAIEAGTLIVDYTSFGQSSTNAPTNYFSASSAVSIKGGATLGFMARNDGNALSTSGVTFQQYGDYIDLSDADVANLVVGQDLLLTRTDDSSNVQKTVFITAFDPSLGGAGKTRVYTSARTGLNGGGGTGTVEASSLTVNTSQDLASLTLDGLNGETSYLDFGTTGRLTLTINAAPIQTNDGSILSILNWSGDTSIGGGTDQLIFLGSTSDFTSVFSQAEIYFDGYGAGYSLIDLGGSYEVVALSTIPEPGTLSLLAVGAVLLYQLRRSRKA